MTAKTRAFSLTDQERAARRQHDRELAEQAVHALRSSTGWQAWLHTRGAFHRYSLIILSGHCHRWLRAEFARR